MNRPNLYAEAIATVFLIWGVFADNWWLFAMGALFMVLNHIDALRADQ